jgi:hypothetical protein
MRKLRLQVQMPIDGYIAGPNNEMDWLVWDDNYIKYINEKLNPLIPLLWDEKWSMDLLVLQRN